jgi:hypothetical protein
VSMHPPRELLGLGPSARAWRENRGLSYFCYNTPVVRAEGLQSDMLPADEGRVHIPWSGGNTGIPEVCHRILDPPKL